MSAEIWRHLGIAETSDEGEVRRAYAERLKTTNPEDDPEGFKRLRNAYERALQNIRWRVRYGPADVGEEMSGSEGEELPRPLGSPIEGALAAVPENPLREQDPVLEAHYGARAKFDQALRSTATPWEAQAAFQALVNDPAMERLGVFVATETWVANALRMHGGGGALLDAAIRHFKWDDRATALQGGVGPSMIAFRETLEQEGKARGFLLRVQDKRHEFYPAYKEVSRPLKHRSWPSRVLALPRIRLMQRFFEYVYDKVPYAEDDFDYESTNWWRARIAFWSRPFEWAGWIFWLGIIAAIIAFFVMLTPPSETTEAPVEAGVIRNVYDGRLSCAASLERMESDGAACAAYLEMAPDSLLMRQYAGIIALRSGRADEARAHFEAIAELSPLDPAARYGLGQALFQNDATRVEGLRLISEALAIDDTVSIHFVQYGVPSIEVAEAAASVPRLSAEVGPAYDTPPRDLVSAGRNATDAAYDHFGIRDPFADGQAIVQCRARASGLIDQCRIVEETPRNSGRGEIALRILSTSRITPAELDGVPVDEVPLRVPVRFRVEGE